MNFGLSFSYVFKDQDWFKKIAIPALCGLIPIVGQFVVTGWAMKAAKNVMEGNEENALPSLEFGADLGRGFMIALISLIYSVPVMIFSGLAGALGGFAPNADQSVSVILIILAVCFGLIGLLLGILIAFLSVIAIAKYVATGEFGAAFRFKELFAMLKKSFVSWLLVVVGAILAFGLIAPLGAIACGIGALLTMAYGSAVYAHLLGQAYNQSTMVTPEAV